MPIEEKKELENLESNQDETLETEDNKPIPEEVVAREKGWKPKEEFQGDPDEWIPAKEFVERGPLYDALHKANKEIKRLKQNQDAFREHYNKVEETAKQKAISALKMDLDEAAEERDIKKALDIKDRINAIEQEQPVESTRDTTYDKWVENNSWYDKDKTMRQFATGIGYGLRSEHPDWTLDEVFSEVTKMTKETFPEKFENPNRVKPSVVEGAKNKPKSPSKKVPGFNSLPDDARLNYKRLVKSGILSHDDFMRDYTAAGGTLLSNEDL